jgi:hypothetical protein
MPSAASALFTLAMLAMASAQGVILKAEGDSGKSLGLQGECIIARLKGTYANAHTSQ